MRTGVVHVVTSVSKLNNCVALHSVRHQFSNTKLTQLVTALMAREPWSWRVIGITPAALKQFAEMGFKYKSRCGITREHLVPRSEMVAKIMEPPEPLSKEQFFEYWLGADRTVICSRGENTDPVPEYIEIENEDGMYFQSNPLAGIRVKKVEAELLKALTQRGPVSVFWQDS